MLNRIKNAEPPVNIPPEWIDEVMELLNSVYSAHIQASPKKFEVFCQSYKEELLLAVSFLEVDKIDSIPVTYIASVDQDQDKSDKVKELLDTMVDSAGVFFDTYFAENDWSDYTNRWEEAKFKSVIVHYRVTRENIGLMLKADELLRNSLN